MGLADSYASMRLEIGSAYTVVFLVMLIPLLMALQLWGQPRAPRKAIPEDESAAGGSDLPAARRRESGLQDVR